MYRILFLLGVFALFTSCLSTNELRQAYSGENLEEESRFFEVESILIKDGKGKKVYKGTVRVYRDRITYFPKFSQFETRIPEEKIHTVYAQYSGGGAVIFTASIFASLTYLLIEVPYSSLPGNSWERALYPALLLYGTAALTITYGRIPTLMGAIASSKKVVLYSKETSTGDRNYFQIVNSLRKLTRDPSISE